MSSATLTAHPDAFDASLPRSDRSAATRQRTRGRDIDEVEPLVGVIPVAGPPAVLIVVPVVLMALLVAGPFVVMLTIVALMATAAALVAVAGWIVASPYLLVRSLRARHAARTPVSSPAPLIPASSPRAVA
jgi:hypothetical protein